MSAVQRLLEAHEKLAVQRRDWNDIQSAAEICVFQIDEECGFVALDAQGQLALGNAENMPAAAAWLDAHDELLNAIEACLGLPMDPVALTDFSTSILAQKDLIALQVTYAGEGVIFLVADGHSKSPQWAARVDKIPADPQNYPIPVEMIIDIPAIDAAELAGLNEGDLILLPPSTPVELKISDDAAIGLQPAYWPDSCLTGILDLNTYSYSADPNVAGQANAKIKMRVAIILPVALLGQLLPGSQPQLISLPQGAAALLSAGEELLASGALVQLPSGLAMEVNQLMAQDNPAGASEDAPLHQQAETEMES